MKFIRLNCKRIILGFCFNILLASFVAFLFFLSMKGNYSGDELVANVRPMLVFTYGCAVLWFLLIFFSAMYYNYSTPRILKAISELDIFDDGQYSSALMQKNWWTAYAAEYIYGNINNYPVVIYLNRPLGEKNAVTSVVMNVYVYKFRHNKAEQAFYRFDWLGRMPSDIKERMLDFVASIKNKGSEKGEFPLADEIVGLT